MKNKVNETMKKSIKTSKYQPKEKEQSLKITFDKDDVIAESATSILVEITPELSVWLSKKVSFPSDYTSKITSYIKPSFEYKNVENENEDEMILGSDLYDYFAR